MKESIVEYLDGLDLEELVPRKELVKREELGACEDLEPNETLQKIIVLEVERIKRSQDRLLQASAVLAQMAADEFKEYEQRLYDSEPRRFAKYSTRVRYREGSLQMLWGRVFHNQKGQRFVKDMPMGLGRGAAKKYNKKQFTKPLEYEETYIINQVEGKYAEIRASLESIQKLRSAIAEYERRAITMFEPKEYD